MTEVSVHHGVSGRQHLTSLNLSSSGIALWGPSKAPTGALRLDLPLGSEHVQVRGRVVREFESDGGSVWGIEFVGVDAGVRGTIASYIAAAVAS